MSFGLCVLGNVIVSAMQVQFIQYFCTRDFNWTKLKQIKKINKYKVKNEMNVNYNKHIILTRQLGITVAITNI